MTSSGKIKYKGLREPGLCLPSSTRRSRTITVTTILYWFTSFWEKQSKSDSGNRTQPRPSEVFSDGGRWSSWSHQEWLQGEMSQQLGGKDCSDLAVISFPTICSCACLLWSHRVTAEQGAESVLQLWSYNVCETLSNYSWDPRPNHVSVMLGVCSYACPQTTSIPFSLLHTPTFDRLHKIHTSNNTSLFVVCVYTHIHGALVCALAHSGTCEGQRLTLGYFPQFPFFFLRQSISLYLEFTFGPSWLSGIYPSLTPSTGDTPYTTTPGFSIGMLNSGPDAFRASPC